MSSAPVRQTRDVRELQESAGPLCWFSAAGQAESPRENRRRDERLGHGAVEGVLYVTGRTSDSVTERICLLRRGLR